MSRDEMTHSIDEKADSSMSTDKSIPPDGFAKEWIEKTDLKCDAPWVLIQKALQKDQPRSIHINNWKKYTTDNSATWKCLWGPDAFFLSFEVFENYIRAVNLGDSGPVCQDSCVEWFFNFNDGEYFNFEFNPIGAYTIAKGNCREGRKQYKKDELPGLRCNGTEGLNCFDTKLSSNPWSIWIVIPYSCLGMNRGMITQATMKANFYKCGDALPQAHYLSWAPVGTENPDFHRPEYFLPLTLRL
jgi:hypothetical protein